MDVVAMSKEELSLLEIMQKLDEKRMRQQSAAEILGVSVRHVKWLVRAYRREGAAGLVCTPVYRISPPFPIVGRE